MSKFNKVFNTKIISLIVICGFLLTNTAYGMDLYRKPHLRKPLDFNNVNGDGRYRSVLSEAAGSKNNGAVYQAADSLSIPRNWEEAANLLLVKKINGVDCLNIYKLWTIFDDASRKTNEIVKDIYKNKDSSGIDTAQKRITTVELFGSVLNYAKDGWVNLEHINDIDVSLVSNFIASNADEKEYIDTLEYNFKKLLSGYSKDNVEFIQRIDGGDVYIKMDDRIKPIHLGLYAGTLWWNGVNLVSPLGELLRSSASAYHKIIFFLRLTGNPLWPAYLNNVEKLGSADIDTFRNDISAFRDNILYGRVVITEDMIKSRFMPPHMILATPPDNNPAATAISEKSNQKVGDLNYGRISEAGKDLLLRDPLWNNWLMQKILNRAPRHGLPGAIGEMLLSAYPHILEIRSSVDKMSDQEILKEADEIVNSSYRLSFVELVKRDTVGETDMSQSISVRIGLFYGFCHNLDELYSKQDAHTLARIELGIKENFILVKAVEIISRMSDSDGFNLLSNDVSEPIKSSISIIFDKSYMDKVAAIEDRLGLRRDHYLRDALKDENFVRDTIKKLELVSKDTHIVDVEIDKLDGENKGVYLITLKDIEGSSIQFISYYIFKGYVNTYKIAEDEMRKDPSLKIFPKVGIEKDIDYLFRWLSVEYIKPLAAEEAERFTPSQKSIALFTAVFKMLNKRLCLFDDIFFNKQYSFTLDVNGGIEAKIHDLDRLFLAGSNDSTYKYEIVQTFEYAYDHMVDIEPKDRILAVLKIGSKYIEATSLINGYASFIKQYPDPHFPSMEQVKEIVEQSAANPAAGSQAKEELTDNIIQIEQPLGLIMNINRKEIGKNVGRLSLWPDGMVKVEFIEQIGDQETVIRALNFTDAGSFRKNSTDNYVVWLSSSEFYPLIQWKMLFIQASTMSVAGSITWDYYPERSTVEVITVNVEDAFRSQGLSPFMLDVLFKLIEDQDVANIKFKEFNHVLLAVSLVKRGFAPAGEGVPVVLARRPAPEKSLIWDKLGMLMNFKDESCYGMFEDPRFKVIYTPIRGKEYALWTDYDLKDRSLYDQALQAGEVSFDRNMNTYRLAQSQGRDFRRENLSLFQYWWQGGKMLLDDDNSLVVKDSPEFNFLNALSVLGQNSRISDKQL